MRFKLNNRMPIVIIEHKENINSNFEGTIIDIETRGNFLDYYDSRRYKDLQQVIFGFINRQTLHIFCAKEREAINELNKRTEKIINTLERPFYAFSSDFERGVLFYALGMQIDFDGELQRGRESKAEACKRLAIPNYDDPFYDIGYLCMKAWEGGEFDNAIKHNRACLLKERDILIKEGSIKPEELRFVR